MWETDKLFHQRSKVEREFYWREIVIRKSRLDNATDLTVMFAVFALLGAVDLNVESDNDHDFLIFSFVIVISLLVANTVFVKIGLLWMLPSLEASLHLCRLNSSEMDMIPPFFLLWDWIWILASVGGFLLFCIQYILTIWIKFPEIAWVSTIIMGAVSFGFMWLTVRMVRRAGKPVTDMGTLQRQLEHRHGV